MVEKAEEALTDLRERTTDTLLSDLGSVAVALESTTGKMYSRHQGEATVDQIKSSKRLRSCVCHLHHEQAVKTPCRLRQFLKTLLQKVQHYKVHVIAGDANAATRRQRLYNSSVAVMLREMQRKVTTWDAHLKADFILNIKPRITCHSFAHHMILIVA